MKITLKLYGNLKRFAPQKREEVTLEVAPGTPLADLLTQLGVPDSNISMCAVNDSVVSPATILHDGDLVEVFEPVGGGSQNR